MLIIIVSSSSIYWVRGKLARSESSSWKAIILVLDTSDHAPRATPPQEHVPPARMWWSGFEAQVVPGAPCRRLLLPPGQESHCAVGAHARTDLAGIGERGLGSIVACSTAPVVGCGIMCPRFNAIDTRSDVDTTVPASEPVTRGGLRLLREEVVHEHPVTEIPHHRFTGDVWLDAELLQEPLRLLPQLPVE